MEIVELYQQGLSIREIAQKFNVPKGRIEKVLVENNIPRRTKSESVALRLKNKPRNKSTYATGPRKPPRDRSKYAITEDNWEIKSVDLRADRKNIICLFVDGKRIPRTDLVTFTCERTGEEVEKVVSNFIRNPVLKSRDVCIGEKHKGMKLSEQAKEIIGRKNSGQKITEYFNFTCPVCGETFRYRNTYKNKKKKYCSKECQMVVWVAAPEFKGEMNELEKYFCTILDDMGYVYKTQHIINYYHVDFFFEEKNIIIQIDGDYWHVNPKKYPKGPVGERQKQNAIIDKKFNNYINNHTNYKLMRIWESDIYNNLEDVKEEIKKALN